MENQIQKTITVKSLLSQDDVKAKFVEVLEKEAASFTSNLAVMVGNSASLQKCDPVTIICAAVIAASMKLPIDTNLGFAAIVPYSTKQKDGSYKDVAQFQMMWRGYVQLAIRTGLYQTMNTTEVWADEIESHNPFTGDVKFTDPSKWKMRYSSGGSIAGYFAFFRLSTGFEKPLYMTKAEVEKHAKRYSKTYAKGYGKWVDDFDSMGKKTVLKLLLSRWGILSIELQRAIKFDGGVINDMSEDADVEYIDNEQSPKQNEIPVFANAEPETKPEEEPKAEKQAENAQQNPAEVKAEQPKETKKKVKAEQSNLDLK